MISFVLNHIKMFSVLALIAGVLISVGVAYDRGFNNGFSEAERSAKEFTEQVIVQLGDDAEEVATSFINCVDSGGVWDYTTHQCDQ